MAMSGGGDQGAIYGINITPLVDVCLVLVIIFMVATPLMMQPNLPVELPKARTAEGKDKDNITISITKEGQWALNETPMTVDQVAQYLPEKVKASRERYIIIRADRAAPYAHALEALRLARQAGGRDFAIATEQKPREKKAP